MPTHRIFRYGLSVIVAMVGLVVVGPGQPVVAAAGQHGAAFVWSYDPAPPLLTWYTPFGEYQYNSTSPDVPNNRVMRISTGIYAVDIPGLAGYGAAHATAYGWDAAYCNAGVSVLPDSSQIDVRCFNAHGDRVDHTFTLSFSNVNEPWPGQQMAYMEVESDGTIWTSRHFSSGGGMTTVTRLGSAYLVRIPGIGSPFGPSR